MGLAKNAVSVVISTADGGKFVGAAVESVLRQSYRNLEVIVVDNDSTGISIALAGIMDDRVICVRTSERGRAACRNAALERARGDYIAFLEPEDRYLPGKLALQVEFLVAHPDVGMIYTMVIASTATGDLPGKPCEKMTSDEVYADIAFGAPEGITLSTVMVRREVIDAVGQFDERMAYFEDIDFCRRIVRRCRIDALGEPTAEIRARASHEAADQDPSKILGAYAYYVHKVDREDADVDHLIRGAGARRLGERAAAALRNDGWWPYSDLLLQQARRRFHPKVSIIIPVYNGANYLAQAIESALGQTYDNVEIIVVDDGSTDRGATERVGRVFGDRIRYVVSKFNAGVAAALNRGIAEMTGDYFSWLSHDDLYVPGKLAVQVEALAQMPDPRATVLYGDYEVFTDNPEAARPFVLPHVESKDFRYFITASNGLHGCTLLVPRQAFEKHGEFDPTLRTTQDYDLWFRMATTIDFIHQPGILVRARSHPEQGTLRLSSFVLTECNSLLAGFVEKLSETEIRQNQATTLAEGYSRLASNLETRGFLDAASRATELCRESLSRSDSDQFRAFMDCGAAAAEIARLGAETTRLAAEVERLCRQRDTFQTATAEFRLKLEAIYHSRSWKVTAPFRYLSRLIGRATP